MSARTTTPDRRPLLCALAAGLLAALAPAPAGAQDAGSDGAVVDERRLVLVGSEPTALRNLADPNGLLLARLRPGAPLHVLSEQTGWLQVVPPGGFPVWVFGRYLGQSATDGVLEVTANAVNMRPLPNNDVSNFPLAHRLHAGDRVRTIERKDPALPLAEDWVRVWSPAAASGWVRKSETQPLPAGADASALWSSALAELGAKPVVVGLPAGRGATPPAARETAQAAPAAAAQGAPTGATDVAAAVAAAEASLRREQESEQPDFGVVRAAFERVLALAPAGGSEAVLAQNRLETVEALEAAAAIRARLAEERLRRERELLRRQDDLWKLSRSKDPLGRRFVSRGVLERRVLPTGGPRYWLLWGGEPVAEIRSPDGRYDLDVFAGAEIGVTGPVVREASVGDDRAIGPLIDIERIEVVGRR